MGILTARRTRTAHRGLLEEIDRAMAIAESGDVDRVAAPVSAWSVGQHLEHLWKVDDRVISWLQTVIDGTAQSEGNTRTPPGRIIMLLGRIPRGRGKAPEPTHPTNTDVAQVVSGFGAVRTAVESMGDELDTIIRSTTTRKHPLLGCYTAPEWLRFAHFHHAHHRRIIEDIRRT